MIRPCFIPESIFYTQFVMLSPRFIPESVFYTQSVVRSPYFILSEVLVERMLVDCTKEAAVHQHGKKKGKTLNNSSSTLLAGVISSVMAL